MLHTCMVTMRGRGWRVLAPPSIAIPSVLALFGTRTRVDMGSSRPGCQRPDHICTKTNKKTRILENSNISANMYSFHNGLLRCDNRQTRKIPVTIISKATICASITAGCSCVTQYSTCIDIKRSSLLVQCHFLMTGEMKINAGE